MERGKHKTKGLTHIVAPPSSLSLSPKGQDDTFSVKSPKLPQPSFEKVVVEHNGGSSSVPRNVLSLSPPNLSSKRSRRSLTQVCFKWRKGRCRKGVSCPYHHNEINTIHKTNN